MLLLFSVMPALASVDLVSPADETVTGGANVSFEYYPILPNVDECTLKVGIATFPDTTITNDDFNTFTVLNILPGTYDWHISCSNATENQTSATRRIHVDSTPPTVEIIMPQDGSTTSQNTLVFIGYDDYATTLACSVSLNEAHIASLSIDNNTEGVLTLDLEEGSERLSVTCRDEANNPGTDESFFIYELPETPLFLTLETNKGTYDLGEQIQLTINTLDDADLSLEICPDQTGFVECFTHLVDPGYPQTITLPYTNSSGAFLIEGIATKGNETVVDSTSYEVIDTLTLSITGDEDPELNQEVTLTAQVAGAIGQVTYAWTLSNGSTATTKNIEMRYSEIGSFTEQVTVEDAAGNTREASFVVTVDPVFAITVRVIDATTKNPVKEATVQAEKAGYTSDTYTTNSDGKTALSLENEEYKLFVSASGYGFMLQTYKPTKDATLTIELDPNDSGKPLVTIASPEQGAKRTLPFELRFSVTETSSSTCTLSYKKDGGEYVDLSGTVEVEANGEGKFTLTSLEILPYTFKVSCEDDSGNIGDSEERMVTVSEELAAVQEPAYTGFDDDPLEVIDRAFGFYDSFNSQQKSLADLLDWEQTINLKKKELMRLGRDYDGIAYRRDLGAAEKNAEQEKLQERIAEVTAEVPLDLIIQEKKTSVEYIKDDELLTFAPDIIKQKGYAMENEQLVAFLKGVQQDFTKETTIIKAIIITGDGAEKPMGIVSHSIKYSLSGGSSTEMKITGALEGDYTLYEVIPEEIAVKAESILTNEKFEMLHESPLRLEFPPLAELTYSVEGDFSLGQLASIETILLRKPKAEELQSPTGNAIFTSVGIDWKLSILLSLIIFVAIFAIRRFDVLRHLTFLFYAESTKKPLHSVRTIINDGMAQIEGGNLDQAIMRYKEAKLSYENLSIYAQNEVYPNMIDFKRMLDNHYFTLLTDRIKNSIIDGHLEEAIDDFARLEGTFEELSTEDQGELISLITELGKRLGFGGGELA
jgi:hypothetical protein